MVFDLSFGKVETFHISLDLCRFFLTNVDIASNLSSTAQEAFGENIDENGRGDSIIVRQDDPQEDHFQHKDSPLSWLGKKWIDFLHK
jgi:hypothetical protein